MNTITIYLTVLLIAQVSAQLTPEECVDDPYNALAMYARCTDSCDTSLESAGLEGVVGDYCPRSCSSECEGVPSLYAVVCINTDQYDMSCDQGIMLGLQMMNMGQVVLTVNVTELKGGCGPGGDIELLFNQGEGFAPCCLDTFDICYEAPCPLGSTGTVPGTTGTGGTSGCMVDAGYSGSVTATSTDPFYTEDIIAVPCPLGSTGTVPGTSGTGGTSGCTVEAGYSGSVTATFTDPFYTEDITAVPCPLGSTGTVPGTTGTGGTSGCMVDAGYSGSVTATSTDPFYTEDIISAAGSVTLSVAAVAVVAALLI